MLASSRFTVIAFLISCLSLSGVAAAGIAPPTYTLEDLASNLPQSTATEVFGINDEGMAIGDVATNPTQPVLFDGGVQYLGSLGGSNPNSTSISRASSINADGQVVGSSLVPGGATHAFLYSRGTMRDLGTLGGSNSSATGINEAGQIVGNSTLTNGSQFAFIYSGGTLQPINGPNITYTYAAGINNIGQVTGNLQASGSSAIVPFIYSNGSYTLLNGLGGKSSDAFAINDLGEVVGWSQTASGATHAFLYDGTTIDLGTLGGNSSTAEAINDAGVIVGASSTTAGPDDGFVYSNGQMYDLNSLVANSQGYSIESAVGINAAGDIAANAIAPNGQYRAVLLTPTSIPVPTAAWAALSALPFVLVALRKHPRLARIILRSRSGI